MMIRTKDVVCLKMMALLEVALALQSVTANKSSIVNAVKVVSWLLHPYMPPSRALERTSASRV